MATGPWYSSVTGGIVNHASSVSSDTTPSTSPPANAAAKREATSRSRAERGSGARSRSGPGRERPMVARARCSALFTDASLTSSMSATSPDRKPSTSRSTSAARCRGGSFCTAATNASAIVSRASYRASGPTPRSGNSSRKTSGYGSSQDGSPRRVGSEAHDGPAGTGRGRRALARSAFRHRLVAIRYARSAATRAPRSHLARARPPAASPAAHPRRRAPSRGSGGSAAEAHPQTDRSAHRTPGHLPPEPCLAPSPPRTTRFSRSSPTRTDPHRARKSSLSFRPGRCLNQ